MPDRFAQDLTTDDLRALLSRAESRLVKSRATLKRAEERLHNAWIRCAKSVGSPLATEDVS